MRRIFGLIALIVLVSADVDSDIGPLTGTTLTVNNLANRMHQSNIVMNNPHLKPFEKIYYINPEANQEASIARLKKSVTQFRKNMKNAFPFAGYSSIDTNLYNRYVKENLQDERLRKLGNILHARKHNLRNKPYLYAPNADPNMIAKIKDNIKLIDKARDYNALRQENATMFSRPYENGMMSKLEDRLRSLKTRISSTSATHPLHTTSSAEEIAALKRLNEKMDVISKKVHATPSGNVQEHIYVQSQMLSGLANLLRKMGNAIDNENREAFLYKIHSLIHSHHLHDHPYIHQFEHELARAIATGSRFDEKIYRLPAPYTETGVPTAAEYDLNRHDALKRRNLFEANTAKNVANEMKYYGQRLVDDSKEMQSRAEMLQRRSAVPAAQRDDLQDHLKHRIVY